MSNALYYLNAAAVQRCMSQKQLKQWWVAEQAGVHVTTMRRWLTRRIFQVRAKHILRLACVLEVSPDEIVYAFQMPGLVNENVLPALPLHTGSA